MYRALLILGLTATAFVARTPAQGGKDEPKSAPSKVVGVTIYLNTAMVTREVTVPEAVGLNEVVVSPLPAETISSSLYSEAGDGLRILSTRYRTRAIASDTREDVRKIEAQIKEASKKLQSLQADMETGRLNAAFLTKLEGFTAATLTTLTEKGQLDSEKTIALATYIKDTRDKATKADVLLKQQIEGVQEEIAFAKRKLEETSGGVVRTEHDAVIVVDKTKPGAATVKLNYLVGNASWKPMYKLRAGTKDTDKVAVEYLATITQQTGEDWSAVAVTLSTAQPLLNAAPPDLLALEVSVGAYTNLPKPNGPAGQPGQAGGASMPTASSYLKSLDDQSKSLRAQSQERLNRKEAAQGGKDANDAAAIEQFRDLLVSREEVAKNCEINLDDITTGPSVTYRLKDKISLPSRNDDQVLEIAKLELTPHFYYKAVPVLTPQVYRIADLTNTTDMILLPGEATTYLGSDFVGQTKIPLVAIGKPFTVGFGADPQLLVSRKIIDKTQTTQGGNQVATFKYRILLNSYKANAVDVQVWDRLPHAEATQTIAVTLSKVEPAISTNSLYLRDERPKNLLRWDVKLEPKQNGDKALNVEYEYKIEFDRNVTIGSFLAK